MRQILSKRHKSLRSAVDISMLALHLHKPTMAIALVIAVLMAGHGFTHAQASQTRPESQSASQSNSAGAHANQDGGMTREEILALFQREARAAYQMNKKACQELSAEDKQLCLARARLQFDADMRYAQKRADQGY